MKELGNKGELASWGLCKETATGREIWPTRPFQRKQAGRWQVIPRLMEALIKMKEKQMAFHPELFGFNSYWLSLQTQMKEIEGHFNKYWFVWNVCISQTLPGLFLWEKGGGEENILLSGLEERSWTSTENISNCSLAKILCTASEQKQLSAWAERKCWECHRDSKPFIVAWTPTASSRLLGRK